MILHKNVQIETEKLTKSECKRFYIETNSHDYLNYFSQHPVHIKQNIAHSLAKRITVFVSNEAKMNEKLFEN